MEFRKTVSSVEKCYIALDRLRPTFTNQFVIEGRGTVDRGRLRDAIGLASAVTPGACLRATGKLGWMSWVVGPEPPLTVVDGAAWSGIGPEGAPFLDRRLDPYVGPTCEVLYLERPDEENACTLIFRSLHAVMDGVGSLAWVDDVMRAVRGEELVGTPCMMTDAEFAAGINPENLVIPAKDALHPCGVADKTKGDYRSQWARTTIDGVADVPVVATLALAVARHARRHADGPVRINIPADLRFYHPTERSTGNVLGTLFLEVQPADTAESITERIRLQLKQKMHARLLRGYQAFRWSPMGLLEGLLRGDFANEHKTDAYMVSATLSYLGELERQALSGGGFEATTAFFIPPMADQNCFITCTKIDDHAEVVLGMPEVFCSGDRLQNLLAELADALGGETRSAAEFRA